MRPGKLQAGPLAEAVHHVERLHRLRHAAPFIGLSMAELVAGEDSRWHRGAGHGLSPITYSTIRPGMLTPVVSMLFLNSIV